MDARGIDHVEVRQERDALAVALQALVVASADLLDQATGEDTRRGRAQPVAKVVTNLGIALEQACLALDAAGEPGPPPRNGPRLPRGNGREPEAPEGTWANALAGTAADRHGLHVAVHRAVLRRGQVLREARMRRDARWTGRAKRDENAETTTP